MLELKCFEVAGMWEIGCLSTQVLEVGASFEVKGRRGKFLMNGK